MTIDSTWLCAFKEELPHAFTPKKATPVPAIFVDGQIKLMQAPQTKPQTWDEFIYRQFTRHLCDFYAQSKTIILAFDNYDHVPRAKCMTQAKRRKNIPPMPFAAHAELPCMVPDGQLWMQCMANRTFKTRVIDLVLLRLPGMLLKDRPDRRLIVDSQPSTVSTRGAAWCARSSSPTCPSWARRISSSPGTLGWAHFHQAGCLPLLSCQ